jgi:hypothetical protein
MEHEYKRELEVLITAFEQSAQYAANSAARTGNRYDQERFWGSRADTFAEVIKDIKRLIDRVEKVPQYRVVLMDVDSDGSPQGINQILDEVATMDEAHGMIHEHIAKHGDPGRFTDFGIISIETGRLMSEVRL